MVKIYRTGVIPKYNAQPGLIHVPIGQQKSTHLFNYLQAFFFFYIFTFFFSSFQERKSWQSELKTLSFSGGSQNATPLIFKYVII